jgi:plastocyanin
MPVHSRVATIDSFATGKTKRVPLIEGDPVYGEEIFSMKYWNGSSGFYDIQNGVNLQDKGGLVWVKQTGPGGGGRSMTWFDTLAGIQKYYTVGQNFATSESTAIVSFNTDGFRIGSHELWNGNCCRYISYTWRKQEKFFTMLQYTGDGLNPGGVGRDIAHDLNGELGMVVVKSQADASGSGSYPEFNSWIVWQRGQNSQTSPGNMHYYTMLDKDNGPSVDNDYWPNSTDPSDPGMTRTHIRVGANINRPGILYNVYIWGHNELPEDCIFGPERNKPMIFNGIIPNNSQTFVEQNMGMPVQWLMGKNTGNGDYASAFRVVDKLRGMNVIGDSPYFGVRASHPDVQEGSFGQMGYKSARGYTPLGQFGGEGTLYMGIGDSAYKNVSENTTVTPTVRGVIQSVSEENPGSTIWEVGGDLGSGTPIVDRTLDMVINKRYTNTTGTDDSGGRTFIFNRFFSNKQTFYWNGDNSSRSFGDDVGSNANRSRSDGGYYRMVGQPAPNANSRAYFYGRPPLTSNDAYYFMQGLNVHRKFFDVQTYQGESTTKTLYHNLEFTPSMIWIKCDSTSDWNVYHKDVGLTYRLALNETTGKVTYSGSEGGIVSLDGQKIVLSSGDLTNRNGYQHVMYLFGEFPGWSKIGLYNGTGTTNIDIDCGFTPTGGVTGASDGGPANLLIKRVDAGSNGGWYLWNSHYGNIYPHSTASGSRYLTLNSIGDQYGTPAEFVKRNPGETGFRITNAAGNIVNNTFALATHNINVTASGSSAYTLSGTDRNGSVSGSNPTVTAYVGDTIVFNVSASGHPFYIRVSNGGANVSTPAASGQGNDSGTVGWIPNTVGTYYYQCGNHSAMIGQIVVQALPATEYIYWAIGPDA